MRWFAVGPGSNRIAGNVFDTGPQLTRDAGAQLAVGGAAVVVEAVQLDVSGQDLGVPPRRGHDRRREPVPSPDAFCYPGGSHGD